MSLVYLIVPARNQSRLDEDASVFIKCIGLVKIPLTLYQASILSLIQIF